MAEKNGIVYFVGSQINGFRAIDAATGSIVWEDTSHGCGATMPVFFKNGKIGYLETSTLFLFNSDGSFDKIVTFGGPDFCGASQLVAFGNSVYFATKDHGFVTFNIDTDITLNGTEWKAIPTQLYANPPDLDGDGRICWLPPAIQDGILYSGVNPVWAHPGTFFAIKLADRTVLWETVGKNLEAWSFWPLTYLDGKLYVLDPFGFGIIDATTGALLVEHNVYYAGGMSAGGYFYKNRVYYTGASEASNEDNPNNVKCVDLATGNAVWMQSFPYSHGSNPVCYEGITYVLAQECMRILDAETGALLAYDTTVHGDIWQECNVLAYKDTLIVKNGDDLICVKMDFRTDGKGKLWQVK